MFGESKITSCLPEFSHPNMIEISYELFGRDHPTNNEGNDLVPGILPFSD